MHKYDLELELAPNINPQWTEDFILESRLRDVPGKVIGQALGEVNDHCTASGETPQVAFGAAKEYARELSNGQESTANIKITRLFLPTFLQISGIVLGLSGVSGLVQHDPSPLAWAEVISLGLCAILLLLINQLSAKILSLVVSGPIWAGVVCGGIGAAFMLLFILPNLWTSPDLPIHAGIVLIVGLGLLGGGVIVDVAETKLNSADDPLIVAGDAAPTSKLQQKTLFFPGFYALVCMAVGTILIVYFA